MTMIDQQIQEVWDAYSAERAKAGRRGPGPRLTGRRRRQIAARLMTFGKASVLRAVQVLWRVSYFANTPEDVFGSDVKVGVLLNQPPEPVLEPTPKACLHAEILDRVLDHVGLETRTPNLRTCGNAEFEVDDVGIRLTVTWRFADEQSLLEHLVLLGPSVGPRLERK
jgi:hypothetical protein